MNIQQMQSSELLNIYRHRNGDMVFISWGPDFPDPDGNATPFSNYEAQSLAWRNAWNDQTAIDLELKAAAVEADPEKRAALYAELTDYVQNNGPYVIKKQPTRTLRYGRTSRFLLCPADTPSILVNISR